MTESSFFQKLAIQCQPYPSSYTVCVGPTMFQPIETKGKTPTQPHQDVIPATQIITQKAQRILAAPPLSPSQELTAMVQVLRKIEPLLHKERDLLAKKLFKTILQQENQALSLIAKSKRLSFIEIAQQLNDLPLIQRLQAQQALEQHDDATLAKLLQEGVSGSTSILSPHGLRSILFLAAERGFLQALKNMDPKIFLQTDRKGNTALHFACQNISRNPKKYQRAILFLLQHSDPHKRNDKNQTPISNIFHPYLASLMQNPKNITLRNAIVEKAKYIKNICGDPLPHFKPKHPILQLLHTHINIVTFAYLIDDPNFSNLLFQEIEPESFKQAYIELQKRFPHKTHSLYLSQFHLNPAHYQTGKMEVPSNTEINDCTLEDLLSLFDQLPWDQIDAKVIFQHCTYQKPNTLPHETTPPLNEQTFIKKQARKQLERFIKKIKNKIPFKGTPQADSTALIEFYQEIERTVLHTIKELRKQKNPDLCCTVLKEYIAAASFCGGRYVSSSREAFLYAHSGKACSGKEAIENSIAQFRHTCFSGTVANQHKESHHSDHFYTHALKTIGNHLGILGNNLMTSCKEVFTKYRVDPYAIKTEFLNHYTPQTIVQEWLRYVIKENESLLDHYLTLQKTLIFPKWTTEKYQKSFTWLEKFPPNKKIPQGLRIHLSIEHDLTFPDIPEDAHEGPTQERAKRELKEIQQFEFLQTIVHDPKGHLRAEAIADLLYTLDIFSSKYSPPQNGFISTVQTTWSNIYDFFT